MATKSYRGAHVSEIVTPLAEEPGKASWRAVRRQFDIGSFGVAAYTGRAPGDVLSGDHTEADTRHEELFFVATGHAAIKVGEETMDAPAGTFVYVSDPEVVRGATALARTRSSWRSAASPERRSKSRRGRSSTPAMSDRGRRAPDAASAPPRSAGTGASPWMTDPPRREEA
jgi:hypothetical protein